MIVRLSDFKSNEYSSLTGGSKYAPHEENPMLGFRGASRYIAAGFRDCFEASKYVGICGKGPSDHPDLAKWLMEKGIGSLSFNPDTVVETWLYLAGEVKNAAAAG